MFSPYSTKFEIEAFFIIFFNTFTFAKEPKKQSSMSLKSKNPYTGELIAEYPRHSKEDIEKRLQAGSEAFTRWRSTTPSERSQLLSALAAQLRDNNETYARLISSEMGKCIKEARGEVKKCAWVCDYYAENGETFLRAENINTEYAISRVQYEPLGVIMAIMPWNFPFWQVFRFAAPNLMAGNVAILKHAGNVSGCALAIEKTFRDAGFPPDVFQAVLLRGSEASKLISDPRIAAVSLTGSTEAGKKVAEAAGAALKKTVLELGGSDPYLVLEDAHIENAAEKCAAGRLLNAGQSCIGAKRFLVHESVYDDFLLAFTERMKAAQAGNPMDENTSMGPLASPTFRNDLHRQVTASVKAGATLHLGGDISEEKGAFYPPTILTEVKPGMPAWDEELFGPVASVIRIRSDEEAIDIANGTSFGLGAAVFSEDMARAEKLAARLDAGCVFINDFVKSDPRLPFGGVKESGYGRELALHGMREFMNAKTVAG